MALIGEHDLAVEAGRSALRLAPHHPEWYAAFVGIALFVARLHEEAIATMAPAPEALCNTPAFIAASYAHLGRTRGVRRPSGDRPPPPSRQLARGMFPGDMSCIDWLLAMDPFQRARTSSTTPTGCARRASGDHGGGRRIAAQPRIPEGFWVRLASKAARTRAADTAPGPSCRSRPGSGSFGVQHGASSWRVPQVSIGRT